MNWSDAMKDNADTVATDRAFANASDMHSAASTSWNPYDVWLTRVKQPRDRAASQALAAALLQSGKQPDAVSSWGRQQMTQQDQMLMDSIPVK